MIIQEDNIQDSELKIEEAFNNCLSGKDLKKELDEFVDVYNFVDIDKNIANYWQNDNDTLIIGWVGNDDTRAFEIGKIALRFNADEFDYTSVPITGGTMTIIRLWWD